MKWSRHGQIWASGPEHTFGKTRCMCPTPLLISSDTLRIYAGFCDEKGISRLGFIDVSAENPKKVLDVSTTPLLDVGIPGTFDDNGIVPVSIVEIKGEVLLYYVGFQLGVAVDYFMFCGLAISKDGGKTFYRYRKTPILDRTDEDLFARAGVFVLRESQKWHLWYVGSVDGGWAQFNNRNYPLYTIKYLHSDSGKEWSNHSGQKCLSFKNKLEHGFGRPFIFKENQVYKMIYSIRTLNQGQTIGYAESEDLRNWIRKDEGLKFVGKADEWEKTDNSYPAIFKFKEKTYLFYNGNGMGKGGFGYAELIA